MISTQDLIDEIRARIMKDYLGSSQQEQIDIGIAYLSCNQLQEVLDRKHVLK